MYFHPEFPNLLQFGIFAEYVGLFHFSTTCQGGYSKGNYATFNLGEYAGDNLQSVSENRQQLTSILDISQGDLLLPHQTHGDQLRIVDNAFLSLPGFLRKESLNGIDALITNQPNICIGITTADCVPILIFDPIKRVLAAIHAGWRGTVAHIASKTVRQMQEVFGCNPANLKAGIAPAISPKQFEVGEEVVSIFVEAGFSMDKIGKRHPDTGKIHIDLALANKLLLNNSGIPDQNIELSNLCTYSDAGLFFSARRQGIQSGRMVTGGVMKVKVV